MTGLTTATTTATTRVAAAAAPRSAQEVARATGERPAVPSSPSLAKGLFLGEVYQDLATPYPTLGDGERGRVAELIRAMHRIADDLYDVRRVEEQRWVGDEVIAALGGAGLLGLYLPEEFGGQGLSQTGYCRVSEEFGVVDPTLAVIAGVHMSIGNGNRDVVVVFARSEDHGHVALIVTPDMDGVDSPFRYDTMGLRGNDLRHVTYTDVRVPGENLIGEPGDGFLIAMNVLNNGRMSLGTGSVGATKKLLDLASGQVHDREQVGQPLAEFELVGEKIAWMQTHLYGLESTCYLTTGMMDAGVQDVSLESAMIKVVATEFVWYAANRAFQLAGGEAFMNDRPYAKILRDIRIFPIFEGSTCCHPCGPAVWCSTT